MPLADDDGHDLEAMAAAVDERTRLVIVCNPNNPTGVYRGADEIERFLDALPEDLAVLVDEAYFEFVDRPDAGRTMSMARERPNLLVTRTFSKAHGLCGLRVGYGVGGAGWIDALDRVRQPFNTNALAQAAALESLRHPAALERRVRETVGRARPPRGRACGDGVGLYRQPGQLYPGRAGRSGRRISGCPRAAPAPRRDRARRRVARVSRSPPGLDRHPGGEHGVPVGAGARSPARRPARRQPGRTTP